MNRRAMGRAWGWMANRYVQETYAEYEADAIDYYKEDDIDYHSEYMAYDTQAYGRENYRVETMSQADSFKDQQDFAHFQSENETEVV